MTERNASFFVLGLCADWCRVCREYQPGFEAMAADFEGVEFRWLDIEDEEEDWPDELEVENFPAVLIQRDDLVLFFGPVLPQHGHLRRMLASFMAMSDDEARRHVASNPEHERWQLASDFRRKLRDRDAGG